VADDAKLMEEAVMLARRLAEGPTRALVATRALVEESEHATYETQFRREIELQAVVRGGPDAIEGRNAFVEKRNARFTEVGEQPLRASGSAGWPDAWLAISARDRACNEVRGGRGRLRSSSASAFFRQRRSAAG
jgi:hypothetical protein